MNVNYIKTSLAVLFLLCLLDMSYGYYQLVRFSGMFGFGYIALSQSRDEENKIVYIGLVLLFQPFFKIALGRGLWNLVDVMVAGWLIYQVVSSKLSEK